MKLLGINLSFLLCIVMQVFGEGVVVHEYSSNQTYDKLQLSELLIKADRILTCVPVFAVIRENDDQFLFKLQDINSIVENDANAANQNGPFFVVSSKKASWKTPVIVPGKKHLLFLKDLGVNDAFRAKFKLEGTAKVFEVCSDWQAAICLDFSIESLARNVLRKRYEIYDEGQFLSIVKNLTRWRVKGSNKPQNVQDLLIRMNSTEGKKQIIYQEHIPQILRHLGVKAVLKNGKFIIEE